MSETNFARPPKERWSYHQKVFAVMLLLVGGTVSLLFGLVLLTLDSMSSEQQVSGQITLTPEWVEITPAKLLKPSGQYQEIVLDAGEPLVKNNLALGNIQFVNGTTVRPELALVDQYGNVFVAEVSRYPTPSLYENGISGYVSNLPQDRSYTKVRVRSDQPLRLSRIVWHCRNGK